MKSVEMLRRGSVGPYEELLFAIESDDLDTFKQLIAENASCDLNNEYTKPYSGSLLHICCALPGKRFFVDELLSTGRVNVNYVSVEGKAGLHCAAENGNENVLSVLLECPSTDVNILDGNKNTALHIATKAGHTACSRLLLRSKSIQPNRVNADGKSATYIAATSEEKNDDLMRLFIKCPIVSLDRMVQEKPLRKWILENYPHFAGIKYNDPIDYLKSNDTEGFIWYISLTRRVEEPDDGNDEEYTCLQYACDVGFTEVVRVLLEFGADPNKTTGKNDKFPVFIAASKGFAEIIRLFLESEKCVIYHSSRGSVIHEVLRSWTNPNESNVKNELCDYETSFNMLLYQCEYDARRTPKIDINWVDNHGNTCLHYGLKSGKKKIVFSLLDHNAYVGKMNKSGNPVLAEFSYEFLESYLDSRITSNEKSKNSADYEISLSYKFLCPPLVFTQSDTTYDGIIHLESEEGTLETDPLFYMSEVTALKPLLVHPVVSSFIFLKWHRIKYLYYFNFAMYLAFLMILTLFILFHSENVLWKTYGYGWSVVLVGLTMVCFRELFQLISSPIKYIMSIQNWLELIVIIFTSSLLFNLKDEIRVQVSAVVILVSWGQILFYIGRHPIQAINLEIFKVVTVNFLKFLIWFWLLIVAFILCFYMLFRYDNVNNSSLLDITEQMSSMTFQTILMSTGEFGDTDKDFKDYPIVSRVLFVSFIFLINIVFMNLLSGLAVSDIQQIKNVSKIIAMRSSVSFIHDFETIVHERNLISCIFFLCVKLNLFSKLDLFPDALKKPYVTIKPNQNFQDMVANALLEGIYLDGEDIVKATSICNLNSEKSNESRMDVYETFDRIEKSMADLKEMFKKINQT